MGIRYSVDLYFHIDDLEKALLATADIAWHGGGDFVNVLLPDQSKVTLPFDSNVKDDPINLDGDERTYFNTSLLFFEDQKILEYISSDWDVKVQIKDRTYIRYGIIDLDISLGKRYVRFSFTPVTSGMSRLFLESEAIQRRFLELLHSAKGVLGLIFIESDEYPLLENPKMVVTADYATFPPGEDLEDNLDRFVENILAIKQAQEVLWQRQKDPTTFYSEWVEPFYERLTDSRLFGELFVELEDDDQAVFAANVRDKLEKVDNEIITLLLADNNWRYIVVGAWFVGFEQRHSFTDSVGAFLDYPYTVAAVACCFAMARLNSEKAIGYLESYISDNLQIDKLTWESSSWYFPWESSSWGRLKVDLALAALMYLDEYNETDRASKFLKPDGPWKYFLSQGIEAILNKDEYQQYFKKYRDGGEQSIRELREEWKDRWDLERSRHKFNALLNFAETNIDH